MAQIRSAGGISTKECCFKNTVDAVISTVVTVKAILQPTVEKSLLFQAAAETATAPITWIEGQTLVFVSNS